jgi:hypothetical protein
MKKLLYLIISLCLVLLVHCATEQKTTLPTAISQQKCDAPIWKVGDSWRYRYDNKMEWEHRVLSIEQFKGSQIYVVEDVYGSYKQGLDVKTLQLKTNISPDGRKVVPMSDSAWHFDFPLYVGKKWEKMVSGTDTIAVQRNYLYTYRVLSFEAVTVLAGTFKAFKIEREQRDFAQSGGSSVITYLWYCPELKREVKFGYGPVSGSWRVTGQGYELKSFKLGEKQPMTPEIKSPTDKVESTTKPQVIPTEKPKISISVTPPQGTNFVTVTGTSANIRSGAGNEFPAITIVKQGDKLILLGEYGEWVNVRLENGQEGWINRKFAK